MITKQILVPATTLVLSLSLVGCGGQTPGNTSQRMSGAKANNTPTEEVVEEKKSDSELLIGVWHSARQDLTVAFDGEKCSGPNFTAPYELDEVGKRITVREDGATTILSYAVDGDALTLSGDGTSVEYVRQSSDADEAKSHRLREDIYDGKVLLDNEYVLVELLRVYETASSTVSGGLDRCFDLKVTNKTNTKGDGNLTLYLGDDEATVLNSGYGTLNPGKSKVWSCRVYKDSSYTPVDLLDDLYTLNGEFSWQVLEDVEGGRLHQVDYLTVPITLQDVR